MVLPTDADDLFDGLGPIQTFNAESTCGPLRTITLTRQDGSGYGFTLVGNAPVKCVNMQDKWKKTRSTSSALPVFYFTAEFTNCCPEVRRN